MAFQKLHIHIFLEWLLNSLFLRNILQLVTLNVTQI